MQKYLKIAGLIIFGMGSNFLLGMIDFNQKQNIKVEKVLKKTLEKEQKSEQVMLAFFLEGFIKGKIIKFNCHYFLDDDDKYLTSVVKQAVYKVWGKDNVEPTFTPINKETLLKYSSEDAIYLSIKRIVFHINMFANRAKKYKQELGFSEADDVVEFFRNVFKKCKEKKELYLGSFASYDDEEFVKKCLQEN